MEDLGGMGARWSRGEEESWVEGEQLACLCWRDQRPPGMGRSRALREYMPILFVNYFNDQNQQSYRLSGQVKMGRERRRKGKGLCWGGRRWAKKHDEGRFVQERQFWKNLGKLARLHCNPQSFFHCNPFLTISHFDWFLLLRMQQFLHKILILLQCLLNIMSSKLKISLHGATKSGKTSLLDQYFANIFSQQMEPTVGTGFRSKHYAYPNGKSIELQFWDLSGMPLFKPINPAFYRGTRVVICVYDITNLESFVETQAYVKDIKQTNPNALIVIVGNKTDLFQQIKVPYDYATQYAQANHLLFFLTSAKHNTGINQLISAIADRIDQLQSSASPYP